MYATQYGLAQGYSYRELRMDRNHYIKKPVLTMTFPCSRTPAYLLLIEKSLIQLQGKASSALLITKARIDKNMTMTKYNACLRQKLRFGVQCNIQYSHYSNN